MIEQTFAMSLKRGIFPLETKAKKPHDRHLFFTGTYTTGARSGYK
jgi:hypothetical protein